MAILTKGTTFANTSQVTPASLNSLVDSATFDDPADETSLELNTGTGKLQVKDSGVTVAKIGTGAVTTAKIADTGVTAAKLASDSVTTAKILDENVTTGKLADDAVTAAKLDATAISGQTSLAAYPDDVDGLLIHDDSAGDLREITLSTLLSHPAFVKAYGNVDLENANTLSGAWNVASASGAGNDYRTITLSNAMASTAYVVLVTEGDTSQGASSAAVQINSTTSFTIYRNESSARSLHFAVFGLLA